MKEIRITVMRKAFYADLAAKYENPIEHACEMQEKDKFLLPMAGTSPTDFVKARGTASLLLCWLWRTVHRTSTTAG